MSREGDIKIANTLRTGIGTGRNPGEIAASVAEDLILEIQGDGGVLPWIGDKNGRQARCDLMHDQPALTKPLAFDVEDGLASERRTVVTGQPRTGIVASAW